MPPKKLPVVSGYSKDPTPFLYRQVNSDWPGLFTALSKLDLKNPVSWLATFGSSVLAVCKLKPRNVGEEAFILVRKALTESVARIVQGAFDAASTPLQSPLTLVKGEVAASLDLKLKSEPIELTSTFLTSPGRSRIVATMTRLLASWFRSAGMEPADANSFSLNLPVYFVQFLNHEFANNAAEYPKLVELYKDKVSSFVDIENAWLRYHISLHIDANPSVLDLGVTLDDVYVELRSSTKKAQECADENGILGHANATSERYTIGMLFDTAESWIEKPDDPIFVLSGGPGAGKSAFARRFAAWRAWQGPEAWLVLFVPLHRFKLGSDLKLATQEFACRELNRQISLFDQPKDTKMLIVFDGLDELAIQGKVGEELAADFFRQVDDFVKDVNRGVDPLFVKVMLCGRPVAVANTNAEIRRAERVRKVLPYYIPERNRNGEFIGRPDLLKIDQREEWWSKYGQAIGDPTIVGVPDDIRTPKLDPLTAEPILNGLIAQCRKSHKITRDTNRAQIYEWLLHDVLNRVHDKSGKQHLKDASITDIGRLLEEVAVTAWHNGDVRTTTKSRVWDRCEETEQSSLLNRVFPDRQKSSISSLFLAFYFQEASERQGQEQAFEFSHKSFGEYLLARRMSRFLQDLTQRIENESWDIDTGLQKWNQLFGYAHLDHDLVQFLSDIMVDIPDHILHSNRQVLIRLFSRVLRKGCSVSQPGRRSFVEQDRQNRNLVLAIIAMHSICYRSGGGAISLDLPSTGTYIDASWFADRARSLSGYQLFTLRGMSLVGVDFSDSRFLHFDFEDADLQGCNFTSSILTASNFRNANLSRAWCSLITIELDGTGHPLPADFRGACFRGANLADSCWIGALFAGADIEGANLTGAHFHDMDLRVTKGDPSLMPDGKPPVKNWRNKRPRRASKKT